LCSLQATQQAEMTDVTAEDGSSEVDSPEPRVSLSAVMEGDTVQKDDLPEKEQGNEVRIIR
jgi:hypothetical protein